MVLIMVGVEVRHNWQFLVLIINIKYWEMQALF